jgi:RNA polymerase sigma-70 factor (ECF subfamily)
MMNIEKGRFTPGEELVTEPAEELGLESIFKVFFARLVYFSFQLIDDKEHARDIVQDAFVQYWKTRDSVALNKTAIKNYLYATVRNASLNYLRHKKTVDKFNALQAGSEPEYPPVLNAIISAELMSEIHGAIESLPANCRAVSVLGYLEGKKNQEIADELSMSVNTVKKQKQKALQLLRLKLTPEMFLLILALFLY